MNCWLNHLDLFLEQRLEDHILAQSLTTRVHKSRLAQHHRQPDRSFQRGNFGNVEKAQTLEQSPVEEFLKPPMKELNRRLDVEEPQPYLTKLPVSSLARSNKLREMTNGVAGAQVNFRSPHYPMQH